MKSSKNQSHISFALIKESFINSLSWFIPLATILATFVILFFGLAQNIGDLRLTNRYLMAKVVDIEKKLNDISTPKANVEVKENPFRISYTKESSQVSKIQVNRIELNNTNRKYLTYGFESKSSNLSKYRMLGANNVCLLVHDKVADSTETTYVFETVEMNDDQKNYVVNGQNCAGIVVFSDKLLVIYDDFGKGDVNSLKILLSEISANSRNSTEIRNLAKTNLELIK